MQKIAYYLLYPVIFLISLLPLQALYIVSDVAYYILYYIVKYRRDVIYSNLRNAFPDKPDQEIDKIAKDFYRHFCDLFIEIFKTINLSKAEFLKRFKYKNPEILDDLYDKNITYSIGFIDSVARNF